LCETEEVREYSALSKRRFFFSFLWFDIAFRRKELPSMTLIDRFTTTKRQSNEISLQGSLNNVIIAPNFVSISLKQVHSIFQITRDTREESVRRYERWTAVREKERTVCEYEF
jgi:hypothetical protein